MRILFIFLIFISTTVYSKNPNKTVYTLFYFGASDCGYCVDSVNIARINKMRLELPRLRKDLSFKFVLVVMDTKIDEGIEFTKHYPNWNELSIGSRYNNELMMAHLNRSEIAGVPHVMLYKDNVQYDESNIPTIKKRTLLKDLVGQTKIKNWLNDGYPIK